MVSEAEAPAATVEADLPLRHPVVPTILGDILPLLPAAAVETIIADPVTITATVDPIIEITAEGLPEVEAEETVIVTRLLPVEITEDLPLLPADPHRVIVVVHPSEIIVIPPVHRHIVRTLIPAIEITEEEVIIAAAAGAATTINPRLKPHRLHLRLHFVVLIQKEIMIVVTIVAQCPIAEEITTIIKNETIVNKNKLQLLLLCVN